MRSRQGWATLAIGLCLLTTAVACSSGKTKDATSGTGPASLGDPGKCTVIDMAVSSEKIALMNALAKEFNGSSSAKVPGGCLFVRPAVKASGAAATLLSSTWDESTDGPRPVVWSPAATAWGSIVNQRLADQGKDPIVPKSKAIMQTPLTIAMPKPMADALGYPRKPVGWADILKLSQDPKGWASYGHPEWGPFRLGKTNPNLSTSGLHALIAQAYADTGKTTGLTKEDLDDPKIEAEAKAVESSVVHYGDTTLTFLNNWYRTDRQGTSLTYASAVAVEEKSVIDYNTGNPDGVLDPGERPKPPRIPLVAIYPKEGTLFSDSPYIVLDAPWVTAAQKAGAATFQDFLQQPANQRKVLQYGFRPGNPDVAIAAPITAANGVDPNQPQTLLDVPSSPVLVDLLNKWDEQRKGARVQIVLDVSGSMSETADPTTGETRLDLAKKAAIEALDQFKPDDEVGLRIFTTDLDSQGATYLDVVPVGPIGPNKEKMRTQIEAQYPRNATPLYDVTLQSYQDAEKAYDPKRINAVVLLTDGMNDDGNKDDDQEQYQRLLSTLRAGSQGETAKPIRIFPIAFGKDADLDTLKTIAEATNSVAYSAADPTTITKVFTTVVSNF